MALTGRRLVAYGALAATAAAVAWLPPEPRLRRTYDVRHSQLAAAATWRRVRRLEETIRVERARDEIVARLGDASGSPTLAFQGAWRDGRRSWLADRIAERWTAAQVGTPQIPVGIIAVLDTGVGNPRFHYVLPATPGDPCLVVLVQRDTRWAWDRFEQAVLPGAIGPCGFHARFGVPGPSVRRWLHAGGIHAALAAPGSPGSERLVAYRPSGMGRVMPLLFGETRRGPPDLTLDACIAYGGQACADFVLDVAPDAFRLTELVDVLTHSAWVPESGRLLSDLLAEVGPERFAAVWRTDQPLPDAFRAAVGEDLAAWTHRWAVRTFGAAPPGTRIGAGAVALSFGAVGLLLGFAVVLASRRRVA